ncbi:MAG: OFA family MFS transporter [Pirellulales bacterium]|nr:OFA family MFS transporter [Pirellulales bacterium]
MSEKKPMNRWMVVVGALLIQICLGAIYAWGTFTPALQARRSELIATLSPELLDIDPALHKELAKEYKESLKDQFDKLAKEIKSLGKTDPAWSQKQAEIKSLDEEFSSSAGVSEKVWSKHYFGFNAKQTQLIFAAGLFTFALVMIMAGRWQDRFGPRIIAVIGGVLLGAGYIAASFVGTSYWPMFFCIGVVGGAGIGMGYVCPIAACVKWFPDMKGFITGLAVAGFGAGAFIFIKLGGAWAHLVAAQGVSGTYLVFGIIFLITVVVGALLLSNPPSGWKPSGWEPSATKAGIAPAKVIDLTQGECVRTSQFWMIWLSFAFSAGCGLMVIGCLKDFGIKQGGLSAEAAGTALGLLALFNGLGRIAWGTASQKMTARGALILMTLLQAVMMFILLGMGAKVVTLAIAACWIGFNFGGNFALFPLLTAESFGTKNLGANYGAVFTAYGIGGIAGPMLSGGVWDALGSYQWAFIPAGVACLLAMLLAIMLRPPKTAHAQNA